METLRIAHDERKGLISGREGPPKYTYYALNNAVKYSSANRKSRIGNIQEIYKEFQSDNPNGDFSDWKQYYYQQYDGEESLDEAVEETYEMFIRIREAIKQVDRDDVKQFVEGIVLYGTYESHNPEIAVEEKLLRDIPEFERIESGTGTELRYSGTPIEVISDSEPESTTDDIVTIQYTVKDSGDIVIDLSGLNRSLDDYQ